MATLGGHDGLQPGPESNAHVPEEVHGPVGPLLADGGLEGLKVGVLANIDP